MIVKYVEYVHAGGIFSETSEHPLFEDVYFKPIPDTAFGFRTKERTEIIEDDGDLLTGQWKNISPWTYFGEELTLNDIPDTKDNYVLRENMKNNNYRRVVKTEFGQYISLEEEDNVIIKP